MQFYRAFLLIYNFKRKWKLKSMICGSLNFQCRIGFYFDCLPLSFHVEWRKRERVGFIQFPASFCSNTCQFLMGDIEMALAPMTLNGYGLRHVLYRVMCFVFSLHFLSFSVLCGECIVSSRSIFSLSQCLIVCLRPDREDVIGIQCVL